VLSATDLLEPEFSPEVEEPVEQVNEVEPESFKENVEEKVLAANESELSSAFDMPEVRSRISVDALVSSLAPYDTTNIKIINREIKLETSVIEEQLASMVALEPLHLEMNDAQRISWQAENISFEKSLNELSESLRQDSNIQHKVSASASEAIVGASISITAGVLVWVLRGGALLASLFSVSPVWKLLDPMPIVSANQDGSFDTDDTKKDQEVEALFDNDSKVRK